VIRLDNSPRRSRDPRVREDRETVDVDVVVGELIGSFKSRRPSSIVRAARRDAREEWKLIAPRQNCIPFVELN
jgi:hypothetical protein